MWLGLRWFHWMRWWGLTCYVDHVWITQHTYISLRYPIPGLSIDSALHYPTLPRGPPLATLAPKLLQLSDISKVLVNQKLAKPVSQLEILEITFIFDAQIKFQPQAPKSHQNPKSHFKFQNLTSNPQNRVKSVELVLNLFVELSFELIFCCWRMSSETLTCFMLRKTPWTYFWIFCWTCVWTYFQLLKDVSSETLTFLMLRKTTWTYFC